MESVSMIVQSKEPTGMQLEDRIRNALLAAKLEFMDIWIGEMIAKDVIGGEQNDGFLSSPLFQIPEPHDGRRRTYAVHVECSDVARAAERVAACVTAILVPEITRSTKMA